MEATQYNISFQGVNEDLTKSTGGYDDFLEYGTVSAAALKDVLEKFVKIELIVLNESNMHEDFCPANMIVEYGAKQYSFIPTDTGKLYCDATNTELSVDEVNDLLQGKVDEDALMPEVTQEQQDAIVRMHNIRPTLPDLQASQISTAPSVPQIEHTVWKDTWWKDTRLSFIIFGVIMFLVALMIPEEEADSATMSFGIAIALFVLAYPLGKIGKTTFKLGLDWDTNTLWALHGKDFNWITNANQIIEFDLIKHDENDSPDIATAFLTDGAVSNQGKTRTWILVARKKLAETGKLQNLLQKVKLKQYLTKHKRF